MKGASFILGLLLAASPALAAEPAKPLFADDQLIQITIRAPIGRLTSSEDRSRIVDGSLVSGAETLPIRLSPRGITRLRKDICEFPPLRVDFTGAPPPTSLFAGQKRLKLVTHCRPADFPAICAARICDLPAVQPAHPEQLPGALGPVDYVETQRQAGDLTARLLP